jgi:hypothetical protein
LKNLLLRLLPVADVLLAPFVYPAAWLLKAIRMAGVERLAFCRRALLRVGVFPIRNHFYEPQFDHGEADFSRERSLPGIDWNADGQLRMLARLTHADELAGLPQAPTGRLQFHFNNGQFESGDAEYWYQVVRAVKPRRIVEIGSGNSTLLAVAAIAKNRAQDPQYRCEHTCIEPYLVPWLEQAGVAVLRAKVEDLGRAPFASLGENDILFIDSSHIIRPRGDVLFEYLELLPSLAPGVIVHVHDIFSPRDYLARWLREEVKFWNEQYLLEAFLSHNRDWQILGALNWLHHHHYERLKAVAPHLTPGREPGSFYLRKAAG